MFRKGILVFAACLLASISMSQILTKEDSLAAGLIATNNATVLSGYGSAVYENNLTNRKASINLDRIVLFVGHKFNKKISFFSELEIEDAKVAGDGVTGEVAMEQAFLKFNVNRNNYITAGLFIPRIGIINENHLPTTFNGNSRPFVEKYIIPATWRELGIGWFGTSTKVAGLNYSAALLNGLSSANFESGNGIRGGRFEGSDANANALALTGALLYYHKNLRAQISTYYGGSAGIDNTEADTLGLKNGVFGTAVSLSEMNLQYSTKKLSFKALACFINIADAGRINAAYNNNTAQQILGSYFEGAYKFHFKTDKYLSVFARYEYLDMNLKIAQNGVKDASLDKQYIVSGFVLHPANGVNVKLDYTYQIDGLNSSQNTIKLGVGYSF